MIIRKVDWSDFFDILQWRNDAVTRSMSTSQSLLTKKQHYEWFNDKINSNTSCLFLGLNYSEKVGICWFEKNILENQSIVSINLNPDFRGRHLSFQFLKCSIQKYQLSDNGAISAIIKDNNFPSTTIFNKCGFIEDGSEGLFRKYILQVKI